MKTGIDIGYSAVKIIADGGVKTSLPSIVGTAEQARFSVYGSSEGMIITDERERDWLVGQSAVEQSRMVQRREDRRWIESDEYRLLFLASLATVSPDGERPLTIVSGLPVAFYNDKENLQNFFIGTHFAKIHGQGDVSWTVRECRVIPQPFGALLSEALDDAGDIEDGELANGRVGVIDCGGKTTNLLSVYRMTERVRETASVNVGGWDIVRAIREILADRCPDLDLRDHEVIDAILDGEVTYFGERVDLSTEINLVVAPMARQVIAQATQLWNGGAGLARILITGGSAALMVDHLKSAFAHAQIVDDPIYANVLGYWKFAQRL